MTKKEAFETARIDLRDAAADVEALHDEAAIALANQGKPDAPQMPSVVDAWHVAMRRYQDAAKAYSRAGSELEAEIADEP